MPRTRSSPRTNLRSSAPAFAKPASAAEGRSPRSTSPRVPGRKRAATLPDLDRVIHERMRLAIVSALAANPSLSFIDLKTLLSTTDGNLSVHARKLEDAGYVAASKTFEGRIPRTEFRLTAEGRRAFERYLNHLEAVVHAGRKP